MSVLRIDFRLLLGIPGSRNTTLLSQVQDEVREMDADFEEELDECLVTPSEALRRIFDGTIPTDDVPCSPYVAALLPLYWRLGVEVGQINFSSSEIQLLAQWDEALVAAGYRHVFSELSSRGAPFPFPFVEPFPTIGFLTPQEVESCHELNQGERAWFLGPRRPPQPRMDAPTFAMFCSWIQAAHGRGEGLVGILA